MLRPGLKTLHFKLGQIYASHNGGIYSGFDQRLEGPDANDGDDEALGVFECGEVAFECVRK